MATYLNEQFKTDRGRRIVQLFWSKGEPLRSQLLEQLTPREEKVIRLRLYRGYTLQFIGENFFKVQKERIRQIQFRALRKLDRLMSGRTL